MDYYLCHNPIVEFIS